MLLCPRCGLASRTGAVPGRTGVLPTLVCPRDGTKLVPAEDIDPKVGMILGNYRLLRPIGQGGMGVVYEAEHIYIGKPVAVKVLHERYRRNTDAVERFLREARAASLIAHPNIVDVTDFGEDPHGCVFFVMEYLEGEPLDSLLKREAPLSLFRCLGILNQVAFALGAAHEKSIVHRDLKPENIFLEGRKGRRELVKVVRGKADLRDPHGSQFLIEQEGDFDFVKVLDFGVAKILSGDELAGRKGTVAGTIFGTPEYMAPEAARGEAVSVAADVYAFGVLFYEILTGKLPFEAPTAVEVLSKQINARPAPPSERLASAEVTPQAEGLILRCLEKKAENRPANMAEVRESLSECYGSVRFLRHADRIPGADKAGLRPKSPPDDRRHRITEEIRALLEGGENVEQGAPRPSRITEELRVLLASACEGSEGPHLLTQRKSAAPPAPDPKPDRNR